MFASLYRAMVSIGLPDPRKVDELYVWECAALLGVGEDETRAAREDPYGYLMADAAYRAARAAAEDGNAPAPDPRSFDWNAVDAEPDGGAELLSVLASGSSFE